MITNDEFIERSKLVHGNKYDYSLVEYKNNQTKVKIICPEHGIFEQTLHSHLRSNGCIKCFKENERIKHYNNFLNKSNELHNNKYDYSLVEYKNKKTKIKIICPIHGIFEQISGEHVRGSGCQLCNKGVVSNRKVFIEKSILIHNDKYDYSLVEYINCYTNIKNM